MELDLSIEELSLVLPKPSSVLINGGAAVWVGQV